MELLTGEYRNTLDEKGRILFPTRLRNELFSDTDKNILIVTQSFDHCLWLYTLEEWKNISSKIMGSASPFNRQNALVLRHFIAPAQEVELDKAGRLSIPQSLREYAHLSKDCVVLGINKYMELWDADTYASYLGENEDSLKEAAEALSNISF
ncbi:MAG: division/cell wall cluster transcriptional repressor MraZ [Treponema sp.]|nr:division/cell wall cluster transcriptional repressor MraZ [Treponema sp.]